MASTATYLNFSDNTEEVFNFYKTVFGTEFSGQGILRYSEVPSEVGEPEFSDADKKLVMHVELPILGGHVLMGTDVSESMGFKVEKGNNVYIMLQPDSKTETKILFDALSEGGVVEQPLQDMFWGDYYGSCRDKFGVQWMFNYSENN